MTTEQVLKEMLTENTGKHMLDSGGAYGRHWSKNQGRDFDSEAETVLSFEFGGIEITHNIYHWLKERIEYEEELDKRLHEFAEREENKEECWEGILEDFLKEECREKEVEFSQSMVQGCNTYNGEDLLSQVMQYWYIDAFDDPMIILRIHGGCDVRGGYTKPRVFTDSGMYGEYAIMDNARATLYCTEETEHNWYTDDAYTFYASEYDGKEFRNLSDYEYMTMEEVRDTGKKFERKVTRNPDLFEEGETDRVNYSHLGTLVADEKNNVGHCPKCGGVLAASAF